ncbi:membrane protein insertion efficiency factor YidD [Edaphobacter dinghuensis]|uniref:Putative membrane protein insertion efficiency factor n=1 Tax=Edaphobacter dinghuensis TaxID=1560005 RepID=A0A917H3P2_9BACT|nr:membrane protein insertion efficiency factor YidD [Edaphobacter dinghuensis]GGG66588.1 putative membrane protein insertion efficiency factor [Edaphobacter dinghuensis]
MPDEAQPDNPGLAIRLAFGLYKTVISPILHAFNPSQCLYLPTCSEYAYVAMVRFGPIRGSWLALRRFARCHPFAKGGLDPVPDRNPETPDSVSIHTDHLP